MMWSDSLFGPNMCRLCAGTGEVCIPIFDKEGADARLVHKIKRCLPISVSDEDGKPKQLCYSCLSKLEICYGLIESSIAADFKFDSVIQNSYTNSIPTEKVLIIQNEDKSHTMSHTLDEEDPLMELRSAESIWETVKESAGPSSGHPHTEAASQSSVGTSSAPATVTVEHVAVHTEQLSSDRVIVLSKVEARGDGRPGEGMGAGGTGEGVCPDILLMVELKYKEVLGEGGTGKVPTITYATSEHTAIINQFKNSQEQRVVELVPEPATASVEAEEPSLETPPAGQVKKFQCGICQKFFMRRTNLNSHLTLHSNVKPFSCDICQKTFSSRWDVTLHKRLHTGQFSCDFCDKVFSVKGKLERHRRVHTGEKPFPCIHCPKAFSDKRNMQAHLLCHTGEKPHSCNLCGRSFRSKSHLTDHKRVHTLDKPFICHICGKNFKWKTTLNMHLKFHAGELYGCDVCGKKFTRRADLKKHILSHSIERPFTCETCSKCFKDSNTLRKHIKVHIQTKPYECFHCGKTFNFQWYLSSHMKVHEKRPMTCDICGELFQKKSSFVAHKKSHTNVKIYVCKICEEQFISEDSLVLHLEEAHVEKLIENEEAGS